MRFTISQIVIFVANLLLLLQKRKFKTDFYTMASIDFVRNYLLNSLQARLTEDQSQAINLLIKFLLDWGNDSCFLLKGYAGTGKTTLLGALVRALQAQSVACILLAPTGRAAKVLSSTAGFSATTIHREIYSIAERKDGAPSYSLRRNRHVNTLFVVDEASMVGATANDSLSRRRGGLLGDLVEYVRSGRHCKLLLSGDDAQLPPVGESASPALQPFILEGYFTKVFQVTLRNVLRQELESGILHFATQIRGLVEKFNGAMPQLDIQQYSDFSAIPAGHLIEMVESSYNSVGLEETVVLCRSNMRAVLFNATIRSAIFGYEEPLVGGDRVFACRNSYRWTKGVQEVPFIANGDMLRIRRVYNTTQVKDFSFADIDFALEEFPELELTATAMLNVLGSSSAALPKKEQEELYTMRTAALKEELGKDYSYRAVAEDPMLTALQLKHGYALTCHKSQGGQWAHVYVDVELFPSVARDISLLRWLYTAITRASQRVVLVMPPQELLTPESFSALAEEQY